MRIAAFDHVRGLAAIFMIISHIILIFGTESALTSPIGRFMNDGLGTAPAAPVFMLLMGVFLVYPKEKPPARMISRGVRIYLLGVVLNVFRFILPLTLALILYPDIVRRTLNPLPYSTHELYVEMVLMLDILQFAGVAFIMIALMQNFIKRSWGWLVAGIAVVLVSPHLWGTGENWGIWYNLVQPLWGNALSPVIPHDTAFPAFPWLAYPIAGIVIGKAMASGHDESWIFNRMLPAGLFLFLGGAGYIVFGSTETLGDYYRMYPGGTSMVLGFALLWTCLFMWLSHRGLFQTTLNRLVFWSENITLVYCVSWTLLGLSILVLGFRCYQNPWVSVVLIPIYVLLTKAATVFLMKSGIFMRGFRWFLD